MAGHGFDVEIFDDIGARNMSTPDNYYGSCASINNDCHSWDTREGLGYFNWKWGIAASDGMMMGPFPRDMYGYFDICF